jgi:hypothetical protein
MSRRHMFYKAGPLFLVTILLVVVSLSMAGCTNKEDTVNKLDGTLNQLIRAEEQGEAEEFARQGNIKLVDGSVRVEIECLPGRAEEVARAAGAFGIVEGTYRNLVQAVVPITNLNALDEVEGIRFIRMPRHPEEEAE